MRWELPVREMDREFDRINASAALRSGFASSNPRITPEMFMAALRATPTGAGTEGFIAALKGMLQDLDAQKGRGA